MSGKANYDDRLKDYVDVKERVRLFYDRHPDGRLVTGEVRLTKEPDGVPRVLVEAAAYRTPDDPLPGRGWSWMILPGTTPYTRGSEIENAETSAWGRAIGALGIGISASIASRDEIDAKAGEAQRPIAAAAKPAMAAADGGVVGTADIGKGDADFELRPAPDGQAIVFRLVSGGTQLKVIAYSPLAEMLAARRKDILGVRSTAWGSIEMESWDKVENGKTKTITYPVLTLSRIKGPTFDLAMPEEPVFEPGELDAIFDDIDKAKSPTAVSA